MNRSLALREELKDSIIAVEDFPNKGVTFRDITPILESPALFDEMIEELVLRYEGVPLAGIVALEARGFIIGAPLAKDLSVPFIPMRKKGKLPRETIYTSYELEYGFDVFEIHIDSIDPNGLYLIVDDLLATGGTAAAAERLIMQAGAKVTEVAVIIELENMRGREKILSNVFSLIKY